MYSVIHRRKKDFFLCKNDTTLSCPKSLTDGFLWEGLSALTREGAAARPFGYASIAAAGMQGARA
jgi:hypothetical protein